MNSKYKELTDKAFLYHQNGDLKMAATIYKSLLNINPDDANVLNLMGLLVLSLGEAKEAINYLTKAFIINHSAEIANNLAKAYYTADMPDKAVKLYLEALKQEENDDIYYSLGLAYKKTGDIEASIEAYKNALEQNPGNYSACYNLAIACNEVGDTQKAIFYGEKCAILKENDEYLYGILSGFYEKVKDYKSAIKALEKAIALNPDNYLYYYNAAVLNTYINNNDKAVYYYLNTISHNPKYIEAYVNLSNIIKKQDANRAVEFLLKAYNINPKEEKILLCLAQAYKDIYRNEDSLKVLKELLLINPVSANAYSIMAMNYMDLCEYEKALQNYDIALKLNPSNLNFQHGRAVALKYLGKIDECLEILEQIVNNKKASLESKITLGMLYLQNKDLKKGMKLYRLRSDNIKNTNIKRNDIWEPDEDISNKKIIVYSNCGLGDSIMYARYLPLLRSKTEDLILQTDKELVNIMQESFPMVKVIRKSVKPPKFDKILQFMDIQLALNMNFDEIPSSNGYLKANEDAIKMFSKLPVLNTEKKKAGLFWQGNRKIFKNRSIKFDIINKLTENNNYNFYSFQIEEQINETDNLFSLSKYIKDYADTAALLKNMDVLITIDSSIAHMAGALGVKTYLLLPKTAEWRWFDDEKTTPWYDSITIFKQTESANWEEVIERINKAL